MTLPLPKTKENPNSFVHIFKKKKTVYMDIQIQITSQMAFEYAEFKPKTHSHCKLKDNMHNMYYIIMCKDGKEI